MFFFDGLSRGLGGFNVNVTKCVDDGDKTVEQFKQAFTYFEDRKIFEGKLLYCTIWGNLVCLEF